MKSLSEIETTSKRASRAAGFSWGVCEEVGKGVRILEMFNLKGIKNLNDYFKAKIDKKFENLDIVNEHNVSNKFPYCPIILGVSFLDQITNLEKIKKINFTNIAFPLLILPFLSRGSEVIGKKIHFKFDETEFLLNFNLNISSNILKDDHPKIAKKVEINFIENTDNFSDQDWQSLYKLSENTFVEENESLKKGAAGAGLTDND
jgi:hypothetical protein